MSLMNRNGQEQKITMVMPTLNEALNVPKSVDEISDDLTPFRKFGNSIFVAMVNTMYRANHTDLCIGYRAFNRKTLKKLMCTSNGFEIATEQWILIRKNGGMIHGNS